MSLGFGTSFWWVLVLEQWSNSKKSASIMSNSWSFLRMSRIILYMASGITSLHLAAPGRGPLMSRIYPKGLSGAWWALHESNCSLLALVLWPWSHLSLPFIATPGYRGLRPSHSIAPSMVFPTHGYRGATLWMPCSGDISPWRRPTLATPALGDVLSWRRFLFATPYLLATPCLGDACPWRHHT